MHRLRHGGRVPPDAARANDSPGSGAPDGLALILFIFMHLDDDSLELGALAIALTSSVCALVAYAALEGFKIRLYARLLDSIRDVESLYHQADARREATSANAPGMPKRAPASA